MTAEKYYNKLAIKHQLRKAIKYDSKYFEDCIIEIMEDYSYQENKELKDKADRYMNRINYLENIEGNTF